MANDERSPRPPGADTCDEPAPRSIVLHCTLPPGHEGPHSVNLQSEWRGAPVVRRDPFFFKPHRRADPPRTLDFDPAEQAMSPDSGWHGYDQEAFTPRREAMLDGSPTHDIVLHATIDDDGKTYQAVVDGNAALGEEINAMALARAIELAECLRLAMLNWRGYFGDLGHGGSAELRDNSNEWQRCVAALGKEPE